MQDNLIKTVESVLIGWQENSVTAGSKEKQIKTFVRLWYCLLSGSLYSRKSSFLVGIETIDSDLLEHVK